MAIPSNAGFFTKFCVRAAQRCDIHMLAHTYLIPRASGALARERPGDEREFVRPVPNGDSHTAAYGHARLHDERVVALLCLEQRGGAGERHADIELCDRNVDAEVRERLEVLLQVRRERVHDEVALDADAVDRNTLRLQVAHQVLHRRRLRARALDVEVVDVELRRRVGCPRGAQRDGDVVLSQRVEEDALAEGSVIIQWF